MKLISCLISSPGFFFVNIASSWPRVIWGRDLYAVLWLVQEASRQPRELASDFYPGSRGYFHSFFFFSSQTNLSHDNWKKTFGIRVLKWFRYSEDVLIYQQTNYFCHALFLVVLVLGDQIQYSHCLYACLCIKYFEEKIILITFRNFCILWK